MIINKISSDYDPEEFVGWKSVDGNLEVVGVHENIKGKAATYKVTCKICSPDTELFPCGYFICNKGNLKRGTKPCGCAFNPKWIKEQNIVRIQRIADFKNFVIHGFAEDYHGKDTRVDCECREDGHKWQPRVNDILRGSGCPKCGGTFSPTEQEALDKCTEICNDIGYKAIGFPNGYKNRNSRFEYECPDHGTHNVSYHNFVSHNQRCPNCWQEINISKNGGLFGWYPHRAEEQDFLYIMNFNNEYIKVGRSFNVTRRLTQFGSISGCTNIEIISVYTATHKEIYSLEQDIHEELRGRYFQFKHKSWKSWEIFTPDCYYILDKLLNISGINKVADGGYCVPIVIQ